VTVHDGFTLSDLVSYDAKHNEANGERNRHGSDDYRSLNCGDELGCTQGGSNNTVVRASRAWRRSVASPRQDADGNRRLEQPGRACSRPRGR